MATELVLPAPCLAARLLHPDLLVVDCRFSLADPTHGQRSFARAHIPGAVYAHLDQDLSAPHRTGQAGRHPLPERARFEALLSFWGLTSKTWVVAYDDMGGGIAARLWWLLRWLGHDQASVLSGGWPAWTALRLPVSHTPSATRPASHWRAQPRPSMVCPLDEVLRAPQLVDSRSPARFSGEEEPIDPVAGRIPGAVNRFWQDNLAPDGCFKPAAQLRSELQALGVDQHSVFYCGSGVTAAHNLLAMAHAGLGDARMFPGSWSEWIVDTQRPQQRGPGPTG